MARPEDRPGPQHEVARVDVLPTVTDVPALGGAQPEGHGLGAPVAVLDGDDGIGPLRQGRAGHDPHRSAGLEDVAAGVTGGDVAVDRQVDRGVGSGGRDVGRAHGIPIHRGVGEARQVRPRDDVAREDPAQGGADADPLGRQRGEGGEDAREVVLDGQQVRHRDPSR